MAEGDVISRSNRGQWENEVVGMPERSESFRDRDEAIAAGRALAAELGTVHAILESEPTGAITDPAPEQRPAAREDGPPWTTDERGIPVDNPSG